MIETSERLRRVAIIDAVILLCGVALLTALAFWFDFTERLDEWFHKHGTGDLHEFVLTVILLLIAIGIYSYRRWRELSREITERQSAQRQALKSQAELHHLVSNTSAAIYSLTADAEPTPTYLSPAVTRLTGYPVSSFFANFMFWPDRVHPEDLSHVLGAVLKVLDLGSCIHEYRYLHADGTYRWMQDEMRLVRDADGSPMEIVGYWIDVTERKEAEERLRRANDELEARVEERTAQLEIANQELVRKNAELDEFTYVASHDLQEPLRKVIAFGDLLQADAGHDLPKQAVSDLEFMTDATRRMQALLEDLLNLSRAGRKSIQGAQVNLDDCAHDALEALQLRVSETGASVTIDGLPSVEGDRMLLTQLYQNLVSNALKFRSGVRPMIHLTAEIIDGQVVLGVRDNGIGIPAEYAKKIFLPFKRLHGRAEYPGTGIGLAICRKVVERHGGQIWVESSDSGGSHFKFTLSEKLSDTERGDQWEDQKVSRPSFSSPRMIQATRN